MTWVESMNEDNKKSVREAFEEEYKSEKLPGIFEEEYSNLSCLSFRENRKVFLVERKIDGSKMILKVEKKDGRDILKTECEIFKIIVGNEKDLLFRNVGDEDYFLRPYYDGITLKSYIEHKCECSVEESIDLMLGICSEVRKLHLHEPPIIHRDLKPENIVIGVGGNCKIIDFDSAREYKEGEAHDTFYMGTAETAAPEQFGYRQTNVRTDVYGLGVLFIYMLSGQYSCGWLKNKKIPSEVLKFIDRCITFDPDRRYKNVDVLIGELRSLKRFKCRKGTFFFRTTIVLLLIALLLGIASILVYGQINKRKNITFTNSQIESAARLSLGIGDEEAFTTEMAESVKTLILCGDRVFTDEKEHDDFHNNNWDVYENDPRPENPVDTTDLRYFTNLEELSLCNCGITDIPDMTSIPLKTLDIRMNPIKNLDGLNCLDTLEIVNADYSELQDISGLKGANLQILKLFDVPINDFSVVGNMQNLKTLSTFRAKKSDIEVINRLEGLCELGLYNSDIESMDELSGLKALEILSLTGSFELHSLDGIENMTELYYLDASLSGLEDISSLSGHQKLAILRINNNMIVNYDVLSNLPALNSLEIDSSQEEAVNALNLEDINLNVR